MASHIKRIKRKRKSQTWAQSRFSRNAKLIRNLRLVMVASQGMAQMSAIRSAQAFGAYGYVEKQIAYVNAAVATFNSLAKCSYLDGSKTT